MTVAAPVAPAVDPRRYHEAAPRTVETVVERMPVCLYLEVTNRCNLLCTTCPRTYVELEPPADMSWALFTSIVDQVPDLSRAVLHGVGEPMLVKDLPRMVRYLKDRGTYVLFNTNGTVLSEKNGRALIEAGLDELRVSLDASTRASYITVRGKDYFERILKNVRAFRALQEREGHAKPRVSAWLTGLKETLPELPAFVRVAAEAGVRKSTSSGWSTSRTTPSAWRGRIRPSTSAWRRTSPLPVRSRGGRARTRAHLLGLGGGERAGDEPPSRHRRLALVPVPPALERHVRHRQRPGAAVLHRAVLAARLRELHPRRRHAGHPAGDLERPGLCGFPGGPAVRHAAAGLRQLRAALEPVTASAFVTAIVPCLDEAAAIGAVVAGLLANGADAVLVVDGGSRDATRERAAASGAHVIVERRRGYGRAIQAGIAALPPETGIVLFVDGDGSDRLDRVPALLDPIRAGRAAFVHGSRIRGDREPGAMSPQQIVAGHLAGWLLRLTYGARFTDMSPFRAIRRDALARLGMRDETYGWNLEMLMRASAAGLRCEEVAVGPAAAAGRRLQGLGGLAGGDSRRLGDRHDLPAPRPRPVPRGAPGRVTARPPRSTQVATRTRPATHPNVSPGGYRRRNSASRPRLRPAAKTLNRAMRPPRKT